MTASTSTATTSTRRDRFLAARENPLSMERVTRVRYRFADHNWKWHLNRLKELNYRAAIVGRRGSGKSTLLFELRDQLPAQGVGNHYVFVPQESTDYASIVDEAIIKSFDGQVILLDGVERLRFAQRRKLLVKTTRGPGLVISVHQSCSLPTWIQTRTNPALMSAILSDLNLESPTVQTAAQTAFKNSDGNIRDALADLYDQFASGRFNAILSR